MVWSDETWAWTHVSANTLSWQLGNGPPWHSHSRLSSSIFEEVAPASPYQAEVHGLLPRGCSRGERHTLLCLII